MRNRYPVWVNLLILTVLAFGIIYSLPNFYGEDPSVQLSPSRNAKIDQGIQDQINKLLGDNGLKVKASELNDKRILVRFNDTDTQIKAEELLKNNMGDNYSVALNLAPATQVGYVPSMPNPCTSDWTCEAVYISCYKWIWKRR